MLRATTACTCSTSQLPKVLRTRQLFTLLTSKCASCHNGVHFFFRHLNFQKCSEPVSFLDFCASCQNGVQKCSEPEMFVHFDLEMCFAPLRRAIFHLSSDQMAPHPPLWPAYFSILRSHKTLERYSVSQLFNLFAHPHLLSSDLFSSDLSPL